MPFASSEQINEEHDRLVKTGVHSKLEYNEWAAPNGLCEKEIQRFFFCADFSTGLNTALKDFNYPLPCPKDIFAKLNGGKFFSKIDLSDAYLQIPVEEVSSKLLCINTRHGLYKFECLPFRVKVAPAIFQQVMDPMLSGLDFAVDYLDDILMKSKSIIEHKKHVHKFFIKIQGYGLKLM